MKQTIPERQNGTEAFDGNETNVSSLIPIDGMTCLSCAERIEETLLKSPGVREAEVDFPARHAEVRYDPAMVTLESLKAAIVAAGYNDREDTIEETPESDAVSSRVLFSNPGPYLIGTAAFFSVIGFYLGLLTLTSDWENAWIEFGEYGIWIISLAIGLGVQAILYTIMRSQIRGTHRKKAQCTLAASGGISTTAMAACCAHYITLFLPAMGLPFLSAAAAGLAKYQTYFFLAGIVSSLVGIGFMLNMMEKNRLISIRGIQNQVNARFRLVR